MKIDYRERKEFKDYHEERRLERRLSVIKFVTMSILILYLLDFWFLQVIKGKEFNNQAEANYSKTVILKPERGLIRDCHGQIIATNKPSFNIMISRANNPDISKDVKNVAALLKIDEEELQSRMAVMRGFPDTEPLLAKEDVPFDNMAYMESRRELFHNILVREESKRFYQNKNASHILGYIGEVSEKEINGEDVLRGDIVGKAGVEKVFDDRLRGTKGKRLVEVDSIGREIREVPFPKTLPVRGQEISLTIDMELQNELAKAFNGESGAAVFMNPKNGAILALYSAPGYDPNEFAGHLTSEKWLRYRSDPDHPLLNRATQAVYPPGSTFKILIAICALEKGLIHDNTKFYCSGSTLIYGRRHYCWHRGGHGWVNLHEAIVHSCNVFFYHIGKDLEIDDIHEVADRFGFGNATGINLDFELDGLIPNREWKRRERNEEWYPGETISVSIGQGPILVTPIQMANFISAVSTGGRRVTPHISQEIPGGGKAESIRVRKGVLNRIIEALWGVVNEKGTGWRAEIEGREVCGKTGTAQISAATALIDSRRLPKKEREHAWFIGFAPKKNPEIAFAIIVEHGGYGGETAAPIAKQVLKAYFGKEEEGIEQKAKNKNGQIERAGFQDDSKKTVWEN